MKITFEGNSIRDIMKDMDAFLLDCREQYPKVPQPDPKAQPALPPEEAEKKVAMLERLAKARAARGKKKENGKDQYATRVVPAPEPEQLSFEDIQIPDPEPAPEPLTQQQLVALRIRTTEDLQAAYAAGKHDQVLALLSKFGNGAKAFRELQIEDFPPIRKAIDDGALA